jgi:glycosyltransferase involved in cell wall biosynthesis
MTEIAAAFVMEQTLGHVTHYQNLRLAAERQSAIVPTWLPVAFPVAGFERYVPAYRDNWSVRASVRARRMVSRELSQRHYDALFFHTQVTALFSPRLMRRIPTVVSLDATPLNYDTVGAAYGHRPASGSWLDRRKLAMNRDVFAAARALVTWSDWARASLIADYGVPRERISVIAPGAARAYFAMGEERPFATAAARPVRLLFVGGDFVRKGGPLLLEAVREARTQRAFELHIVTQRPVQASPGVIVHNGIGPNSPELFRLFRDADAFVLPTMGECLAVVLMEATAAGLPVISTAVGALTEAAIHGRSAIVVPPGDGRALRAAIEAIVDDEGLRTRLGRAGHALARAKFDAERNGKALLALIDSVARPASVRSVA